MTWVTDGSGTRWVPVEPRKRRKPARALRFEHLQVGDILVHRQKWKVEKHRPARAEGHLLTAANTNSVTEQGVAIGFAFCEHRWFDPVRGERDPVAGEMAAVRIITPRGGLYSSLTPHTLRGLATNGYWPSTPEQGEAIRAWLAQRDALEAAWKAGEIGAAEARAKFKPWAMLLRECGLEDEHSTMNLVPQ